MTMFNAYTLRYLELRLERCLEAEAYEEAALLRDRIKELKGGGAAEAGLSAADKKKLDEARARGESAGERLRRTLFDAFLDKPPVVFFYPEPMKDALAGMRKEEHERYRQAYAEMQQRMQAAILTALREQIALHFDGLVYDPYTILGLVIRLIDHRNHSEEYSLHKRLLLVVDTSTFPWVITKV